MSGPTGNETTSSDFLRVLLALKANVMKDIHVADVCKVTSTKFDMNGLTSYMCTSIDNSNISFQTYALSNITINIGDYVLVLFCDDDFRANYRRAKRGQALQNSETEQKHTMSYGIIIGTI